MQDIISSQERHENMKWFDAGTKKMSCPSFSAFIKLINVKCTMYREMGLAAAQKGVCAVQKHESAQGKGQD